ncbi:MAG TPA: hypothetical protein VKR61_26105 [Bryobacteraceae bacterium]|nr:hypothetical protein [Bryobacteraceae bacterium]
MPETNAQARPIDAWGWIECQISDYLRDPAFLEEIAREKDPAMIDALLRLRYAEAIGRMLDLHVAVSQIFARVATMPLPSNVKPRLLPKQPKRSVIPAAVVEQRIELWSNYFLLKLQFETRPDRKYNRRRGERPPYSKEFFAQKMRLNPDEFRRWFKPGGGIENDSIPDGNFRRALHAEITRLSQLRDVRLSHGSK